MFENPPTRAPAAPTTTPTTGQGSSCSICGWHFERDNAKRIAYDPDRPRRWRREPRTEIRIRDDVFCDVCYERHLWRNEMHSVQGGLAAGIYREALFEERPERAEAAPRGDLVREMRQLMTKIEAAP